MNLFINVQERFEYIHNLRLSDKRLLIHFG
jgi:hypothetical protein